MSARVQMTGPLFSGDAADQVQKTTDQITVDGGQQVHDAVLARLGSVLKHPTGYYESQVQTTTVKDTSVVSDGGVIYGPWLEGIGSRNGSTRFKGYAAFRLTMQEQEQRVVDLAEREISTLVGRLG